MQLPNFALSDTLIHFDLHVVHYGLAIIVGHICCRITILCDTNLAFDIWAPPTNQWLIAVPILLPPPQAQTKIWAVEEEVKREWAQLSPS